MKEIVLGLLEEDNKILIGKRKEGKKIFGGYWDIPGGQVEKGETLEKAFIREFKEETGFDVTEHEKVGEFINSDDSLPKAKIVLYKIIKYNSDLKPSSELTNLGFKPTEEIKKLKITPWTKYFLRDLL